MSLLSSTERLCFYWKLVLTTTIVVKNVKPNQGNSIAVLTNYTWTVEPGWYVMVNWKVFLAAAATSCDVLGRCQRAAVAAVSDWGLCLLQLSRFGPVATVNMRLPQQQSMFLPLTCFSLLCVLLWEVQSQKGAFKSQATEYDAWQTAALNQTMGMKYFTLLTFWGFESWT